MTGPVTTSPCAGVAAGTFLSGAGPVVDFGPGAVARIPDHLAGQGARRVLVVTDAGLRAAGVVDAVTGPLAASGVAVEVFDAVRGNPTVAVVEQGAEHARALGLDAVLALGGGSSLDAAKGIALLAPSPGARADGSGATPAAGLPVVAVPTTAGTGAETNGFGVLEDLDSRQKVYCGDASVVPRVAVLDPELTYGLPAGPTAATGVDALVHGLESLASRGRDPMSEAFAAEAVRRAWAWLPTAVADGAHPRARAEMLVAAHLAGQALTRSGLGLVHGFAHALSLHTGAVHGLALAAVLPEVVAWQLDAEPAGWGRAAEAAGLPGATALPDALAGVLETVGARVTVADLGARPEQHEALARTALADPVTRNTPRHPASAAELVALLRRC
ncbi:iron-containing alcohol dehydrogenase family protein [Actinomycetospora straminea]|uniref:iron-containing alcohol dehydrogenase family protein n=1 Tax=Actinomycetospora straminea TaxID=663607 RepID=UPI002366891C|nr:iron-containing alcohol dehydrogenase [Actinomycetospora straminea]MDD7934238.1 iron-containing alcohol dehydrogenase [Actinomycetospora straminea]